MKTEQTSLKYKYKMDFGQNKKDFIGHYIFAGELQEILYRKVYTDYCKSV